MIFMIKKGSISSRFIENDLKHDRIYEVLKFYIRI